MICAASPAGRNDTCLVSLRMASTQIGIRLPDDLVRFIDSEVDAGHGRNRADFVTRAIERERRRASAARDALTLAATRGVAHDQEMDALADWSSGTAKFED